MAETGAMEERAKEYLGLVCNFYIVALLLALPLYMKEGYWQLGDAKYVLFRNISLICLFLWAAVSILRSAVRLWGKDWGRRIHADGRLKETRDGSGNRSLDRHVFLGTWSWTDGLVLAYGAVSALSCLFSEYPATAWLGYRQWYMGLFSQLLFVWIYFLVSRSHDGGMFAVWVGQGGLLVVSLLGILNRMGVDPLGVFAGWQRGDWEYTHLLSTVGNINWLCGYLCVSLPLAVVCFLRAKDRVQEVFFYSVSLLGLLLLCVQSSDSGLLILGIGAMAAFCLALRSEKDLRGVLALGGGLAAMLLPFGIFFEKVTDWKHFPWDDQGHRILTWKGWPLVALLLLAVHAVSRKIAFSKIRRMAVLLAAFGTACGALFVFFTLGKSGGAVLWDYSWGNGRGGLWTLAVKSFREGNLLRKLLGVGPDCFGEHVFSVFATEEYLTQDGPFADAVFTNAHNEWLNQLVNTGILGMAAYLGIFAVSGIRYLKGCRKDTFLYLGILTLALYAANASFSFQEVMNAPFLFLVLGLCENRLRRTDKVERLAFFQPELCATHKVSRLWKGHRYKNRINRSRTDEMEKI
ncbi:MAG: O-antigen ligase family protein [Clostridium sp.]|jgi:O-antigen ligase|nr:O-antigen ligase family protein [Clostridium sp.]